MRMTQVCWLPLCATVLLATLASAQTEDDGQEEAKAHFFQGVALFEDANYEAALVEFKTSYKANLNFKVLYNIGLTLQALHRYVEAEEALSEYLVQGADKVPEDRIMEVTQIIAELRGVIGYLEVTCNVEGAVVMLDGAQVGDTPLEQPLKLNVGSYEVAVQKDGYTAFETSVDIPGKETVILKTELESTAQPSPPEEKDGKKKKPVPPVAFYATAGGAVALAIAAAITGGMAATKHKQFLDTAREDVDTWQSLRDQGQNLALATDVLFGIAGAAAAAAIVMIFFTDFGKKKEKPQTAFVSPWLGEGAGLAFTGTFTGVTP